MNERVILLVEDNQDDEELTLRAFQKAKIFNPVIVAHDGVEALDHLLGRNGKQRVTPQVILLDLNLPKVNGLEVLQQVRANELTKLLPIVILTSSVEEQDIIRSYDLGANSYIRKPVDFTQFVAAVSQLGLYWLVLNQPTP
jgi:two-component system response regulator